VASRHGGWLETMGWGDTELSLHGGNDRGWRRAFPVNETRRERLLSLVPPRGSDDTATMRRWGPLSAVGCGDDVAAEAGRAEWWRDGEGRGRMADGGGGFKVGRDWAAQARERWCRAGGAHVVSRGAKRREGSGTRERKEGAENIGIGQIKWADTNNQFLVLPA
jgi:hypothetical protein